MFASARRTRPSRHKALPTPDSRSSAGSVQAEAQIHRETASNVAERAAEVSRQLTWSARFLQGISQHGQAVRIKMAAGQLPLIVCSSGERDDGGRSVNGGDGDGAERVAEDTADQLAKS